MGGQVNSYFGQIADQQSPCITDTVQGSSSFTSCLVWLAIGLVLGGLTFSKKGKQTV